MLSLHFGIEKVQTPSAYHREVVDAVMRSPDVDLWQHALHRDGVIVCVTITAGPTGRYAVSRMGYVPTFVQAPDDVVRLAPPFSRNRTSAVLRSMGAPITDDTP